MIATTGRLPQIRHSDRHLRKIAVAALSAVADEEERVNLLIEALQDEARGVRAAAARQLRPRVAYGCIEALIERLSDPAAEVRSAVVRALRDAQGAEVEAALGTVLLRDAAWFVRCAAVESLSGRESEPCLRAIVDALSDPAWAVRSCATRVLWTERRPAAVARLEAQFSRLNDYAKLRLALALADVTHPEVEAAIVRALSAEDPEVRLRAVAAWHGNEEDIACEALLERGTAEPVAAIRLAAMRGLWGWTDPRYQRLLEESFLGSEDWLLAEEAARLLAEIGDEKIWRWMIEQAFTRRGRSQWIVGQLIEGFGPWRWKRPNLRRMHLAHDEGFADFCAACREGDFGFLEWYVFFLEKLSHAEQRQHLESGFWEAYRKFEFIVMHWILERDMAAWSWIAEQFSILGGGEVRS